MSDYTPPPDDVEAAAKAMLCPEEDWEGSRAAAKGDVTAAMLCLHARGWRDPAEVAAMRKERDYFRSVAAAGDAARAEVEDWKRQCATRSSDIGRLEGALATLTADRDALAAQMSDAVIRAELAEHRLARYQQEFGDVDGLRAYVGKFQTQRDAAEARAARLAAALLRVKAAIEANATDTLWCDDQPRSHATSYLIDAIDTVLGTTDAR